MYNLSRGEGEETFFPCRKVLCSNFNYIFRGTFSNCKRPFGIFFLSNPIARQYQHSIIKFIFMRTPYPTEISAFRRFKIHRPSIPNKQNFQNKKCEMLSIVFFHCSFALCPYILKDSPTTFRQKEIRIVAFSYFPWLGVNMTFFLILLR